MSVYEFTAVDAEGVEISGRMEAGSEIQLVNRLAARGYFPSEVSKESQKWNISSMLERVGYGERLSRSDILLFTRQIGSLLSAGIPLTGALSLTSKQSTNKKLIEIADGIKNSIEEGSTLSEAVEKRGDVFSDSYISMIKAGEESGNLPSVFKRLADLMEIESERIADVKSAVTYPAILILAAIAGSTFLIVGVFPTFAKIFEKASVALPWSTRLMLALGEFARSNYILILSVLSVLIISSVIYLRTEAGRIKLDEIKLKIPLFGQIFLKSNLSRMAHNYGAMNASGIQVYRALEVVAEAISNSVVRDAVLLARDNIKQGETISRAFEKVGKFPPLVIHLLSIGEESGQMNEMLGKISEYYDIEVDRAIKKMTKTIEPALILIMGVGVAFMYLSLITPMMQMMKVAKSGGLG